jgi:ABC-type nitrate/sulfonate/bicarbonate transport system permease component
LSPDKKISTRDVRAVSNVTIYIPSFLKYIFTSLRISFRTSNVDLKAAAWIVTNFMISI